MPRVSTALDYEGELGMVIGKPCRNASRDRAHEFIAGYLIVNDVSVRDWQMKSPTGTLGKSFDIHGPIGPWIVTTDELPDPHSLQLRTLVNGEQRQFTSTGDMLFDCFAQIELLSTVFTLQTGTIIATGTPSGVGAAMKPPCFLKVGDRVLVEIAGVGHIENPVVAE
jgi:2-keto-4-pentenoate hydratase/2-oxohepta-3-ene-1,7-dioic acid hydratase in catechol pathway